MAAEIPSFSTIDSDKQSYRSWKRLIQHAGKRLTFDILEPQIRTLSTKIRNRQHTACDKSKSIRPSERRRILLRAFEEIAASQELLHAHKIADDPDQFIHEVSGIGSYVLFAGVLLVEAMLVSTKFEFKVMGTLSMLSFIDENIVEMYWTEASSRIHKAEH